MTMVYFNALILLAVFLDPLSCFSPTSSFQRKRTFYATCQRCRFCPTGTSNVKGHNNSKNNLNWHQNSYDKYNNRPFTFPGRGDRNFVRLSFSSSTSLSASEASYGSSNDPTSYPKLSPSEIESFLSSVPVYGITSVENESLLLFEEEDEESGRKKNVANFYVTKEMADLTLSRLGKEKQGTAQVQRYDLGRVWQQLLFPSTPLSKTKMEDENEIKALINNDGSEADIEYRLVPDEREVLQAQSLFKQSLGEQDIADSIIPFQNVNEIPVFMDLRIRLETNSPSVATGAAGINEDEYTETFPMFLGFRDLMMTCQQYAQEMDKESGEDFKAAISVGELSALVEQMGMESSADFRTAALVPPSPFPMEQENGNNVDDDDENNEDDGSFKSTIQW